MKRNQTRIIVGAAISAAVIAVAVDHTRQRLPEPDKQLAVIIIDEGEELPVGSNIDCDKPAAFGRQASPCSL